MRDLYFAACSEDGGIYHYKTDGENFEFCEKFECKEPMYLAIEQEKMHVILRDPYQNGKSYCGNLDITDNGELQNLSELNSTEGVVACHLYVEESQIYAVNYLSGNVIKLPEGKVVAHKGKGVNLPRQDSPHTHFVTATPDKNYICVVDLGLDKIFIYDKNLNLINTASVPLGYGCRHLAFNEKGDFCYCVNELKSSVTVFSVNGSDFKVLNTFPALPNDFTEKNTAAAIRIYKDYLYVSNRGHNSIACFKIMGEELELLSFTDCGGDSPRDFDIFDGIMYVTNETSGNVTLFRVNKEKLEKLETEFSMPNPLCVVSKKAEI